MQSQKSIKSFEFKRFRPWIFPKEANYSWFCNVMKHLLIMNPLEKLIIDTSQSCAYFKDSDFLVDQSNNNLKELTYILDSTDKSELFKIFTRIFPQTNRLVLVDIPQGRNQVIDIPQNLHLFKNLKDLNITTTPGSLEKFSPVTAAGLTSFYFHATNEDKSLEKLKQIFSFKSQIESFGVNIEPLTMEEFLELIVTFSETLKKLSIVDLHLNVSEAELMVKNFPNLRLILSDVPISQDVQNFLKRNNITFTKINFK